LQTAAFTNTRGTTTVTLFEKVPLYITNFDPLKTNHFHKKFTNFFLIKNQRIIRKVSRFFLDVCNAAARKKI